MVILEGPCSKRTANLSKSEGSGAGPPATGIRHQNVLDVHCGYIMICHIHHLNHMHHMHLYTSDLHSINT